MEDKKEIIREINLNSSKEQITKEYLKGYIVAINVALAGIYDKEPDKNLKQALLKIIELNKQIIREH